MNVAIGPILAAIFAIAGLLGFNLSEEIQAQVVSAANLITNGVLGMIVAYGAIKAVQAKKVNDTAVQQAETSTVQAATAAKQDYMAAKQEYAGAQLAEETSKLAETKAQQDATAVNQAETAAQQTDTTATQTDTTAKHADATAKHADATAKQADATAKNADATAKNADAAGRLARTQDEHADVDSQRGFIRLSSMVALAIMGVVLAIAAGCASFGSGSAKLTPDQRAAAVLIDAKAIADTCGELYEADLIAPGDGMACLRYVTQTIEFAQTAHFLIVAGDKSPAQATLIEQYLTQAEQIITSIQKVIASVKAENKTLSKKVMNQPGSWIGVQPQGVGV